MSVSHRIDKAKEALGIRTHADWAKIRPEEVLSVHDCGPVTLDHIRIYLAARGLTLKDDQTPEFWNRHLAATKIGHQMGEADRATSSPLTILVDAQEKLPWTFQGIRGRDGSRLIVPWVRESLGPTWGDYAIRGWHGYCHIDRKSVTDCVSTVLSHGSDRRERFVATLERLSSIECGAIVVEGTLPDVLAAIREGEGRDKATKARTLFGQLLAWQTDYSAPWIFAGDRRMAEVAAYRIMDRWWRWKMEEQRMKPAREIRSAAESDGVDEILGEL